MENERKKTSSLVSLARRKLSLALSYLRLEGTKLTFASCYLSLEGTKLTFAPYYLSLQGCKLSLQWIKMKQKGTKVRFWRKKEVFNAADEIYGIYNKAGKEINKLYNFALTVEISEFRDDSDE